jgi:hypothetical protein
MRWRRRPHDRPLATPAGHPYGPCRIHVPRYRIVNVTTGPRNTHRPSLPGFTARATRTVACGTAARVVGPV